MSKPVTTISVYGAIQINGNVIHRFTEKLQLQQLILESMKMLMKHQVESRDVSTLEILTSKRPIIEEPKSIDDGIKEGEYSVATSDADHAALAGLTLEEYQRIMNRNADPLFAQYQSVTPASIGDILPSHLHMLREYVRTNYPEYPITY